MRFLADDGTIFDDYDACEEYETYQTDGTDARHIVEKFVTLYDKNVNPVPFPNKIDCQNWWYDFADLVDSVDKVMYITISYDCTYADWLFVYNFVHDQFGVYLPENVGAYKYNWKEQKWELDESEEK